MAIREERGSLRKVNQDLETSWFPMNLYKCEFLSADVSTESLDLIFDPDKAAKREQDILASQEDARDEMIKC